MLKMETDLKIRQGGILTDDGWFYDNDNMSDPPPTPEEQGYVKDYSCLLILLEQTGFPLLTLGADLEALEISLAEVEARVDLIERRMYEPAPKKQCSEEEITADKRWTFMYEELLEEYTDQLCDNRNLVSEKKARLRKLTEVCTRYQACVATIDVSDLEKAVQDLNEALNL